MISISLGVFSPSNVSDVPQLAQNRRAAFALERKLAGSPAVHRNASRGTVNQATEAAPTIRSLRRSAGDGANEA